MNPMNTRLEMVDRERRQAIDDLEKKRDDLAMVLGWVDEGRATEIKEEIEALTMAIIVEIRHRGRCDGVV